MGWMVSFCLSAGCGPGTGSEEASNRQDQTVTVSAETANNWYPIVDYPTRLVGNTASVVNRSNKISKFDTRPELLVQEHSKFGDWGNRRIERYAVNWLGGMKWISITGYDKLGTPAHAIQVHRYVSEWSDNGSSWTRMDDRPNGKLGHPYLRYQLPPSSVRNQHRYLRVWGKMSTGRKFFWYQKLRFYANKTNPWLGTKLCIEKREAWWDSVNGWVHGGSGMTGDFVWGESNAIPNGNVSHFGKTSYLAKDYGAWWYIVVRNKTLQQDVHMALDWITEY